MPEYDNTNKFALFPVDERKSENHPTLSGTLNVDGVEYFIDGWTNVSKSGKKYINGKIKRKEKQQGGRDEPRASRKPASQTYDREPLTDDEIPF